MKNEFFELIQKDVDIFKLVEENKAEGISFWRLSASPQYWISPGLWKNLGYEPTSKRLENKDWQDLIFEEDHQLFLKPASSTVENKVPFTLNFRVLGSNGSPRHFRNTIIPILKESGDYYQLIFHSNIEGEQLGQNLDSRRAKRFKEIISTQGQTMMVLDQNYQITEYFINGMDSEHDPIGSEFVGKHLREVGLSEESFYLLVEAINDTKAEGSRSLVEYKIQQNGKAEYYTATVSFIKGGDRHTPEIVIVTKNTTKEKETLMQLAELSSIVSKTNDIAIITDSNGKITWVNHAFEVLTGCKADEFIGKMHFKSLYGLETDKVTRESIEEAFHHCNALNATILHNSTTNEKRWLELRLDPVFNEVGHCTHFVCIGRDITQRKMWEDELLATQQFLQQTSRVGKIGGWSYEVASDKVRWTDVMYEIHEVDSDFYPSVEHVINFYEEGENRNRYFEAGMNAIQFGTSYNLELKIITASGNRKLVRVIGNSEMVDGVCAKLFGTFQLI